VRLYATEPIERCTRIYCDTDSHTSVALVRIVLAERYGIAPELVPYDAREHVAENRPIDWPPAMLLIGDKVVTDSPPAVRYPHQLDLGREWRELTGLPFVFAVWMARRDAEPARLHLAAALLDRQRRYNRLHLDRIVGGHASSRGWPIDLAADYLARRLDFAWDDAHREGLRVFFEKARDLGCIDRVRPLAFFEG
jgi:chorismate dehydratase